MKFACSLFPLKRNGSEEKKKKRVRKVCYNDFIKIITQGRYIGKLTGSRKPLIGTETIF